MSTEILIRTAGLADRDELRAMQAMITAAGPMITAKAA